MFTSTRLQYRTSITSVVMDAADTDNQPKCVAVVLARKGGVGKTTVVQSLAKAMARRGQHVGVLDMDLSCPTVHDEILPRESESQRDICYGKNHGWTPITVPVGDAGGSIKVFSVALLLPPMGSEESGDEPPSSFVWLPHRKRMLVDQFLRHVVWGSLDVLLIDTPPSVGDVHSALLDTLRVLPASTVLLVAEEGSAASAAATRCDAIFCRAKHIRVAGIVGTKTRGVVPDGDGNDGGGGDEGGVDAFEELATATQLPIVARLPFQREGGCLLYTSPSPRDRG